MKPEAMARESEARELWACLDREEQLRRWAVRNGMEPDGPFTDEEREMAHDGFDLVDLDEYRAAADGRRL